MVGVTKLAWQRRQPKADRQIVPFGIVPLDQVQLVVAWPLLDPLLAGEGVEHRVKDDYERNKLLIDLTAQPQDVKDRVDEVIRTGVRTTTTPQVGVHFMKFCGKYELTKISEQAETYAKWLNTPYKGQLCG